MFKRNALNKVSAEHFRSENKRIAKECKQKCVLTDAEKVKNGTHKWVREGKKITLKKINKDEEN
ncbi:hypothetical protein [Polaribacter sp.]|uniref:hypothetical protein n=1 Tax=Polaribacter sp. TaxID=1920175 RepID=UPI003F6A77D9